MFAEVNRCDDNMMALILDTSARERARAHTPKPQPAAPESPVSRFVTRRV